MNSRSQLLRITKQSIVDVTSRFNVDEIAASDKLKDRDINSSSKLERMKDRMTARVINGLTPVEKERFKESRYRARLAFGTGDTVSRATDDSEDGQASALAGDE